MIAGAAEPSFWGMRAQALVLAVCLAATVIPPAAAIDAPVLKWQRGGCPPTWCKTGWYSSPAVADLDGNGTPEVVGANYDVFALDGAAGAVVWLVPAGYDRSNPGATSVGRTWPGVVIADIDGDGRLDVITAHSGGWLSVYERDGYFKAGWPAQPATSELRGLSAFDLDGDGKIELICTMAQGSQTNAWVYGYNGAVRAGWPQLTGSVGYAWGAYNANAAVGDLDGDPAGEIVVPSDVHYVAAYEADGSQIAANPLYGMNRKWSQVGVWESYTVEKRGFGACDGVRAESYRTNFASGPAVIADVDGNGIQELVVNGSTYDCWDYTDKYAGPHIFRADRGRWAAGGWDWTATPVDTGSPLSVGNFAVIEDAMVDPVVADIDGDGAKEILYSSYDGRVHAFWLDKTEHGSWPYSVYSAPEGIYRYASPPVIADLDADGHAEVIFASWPQKTGTTVGHLFVLDYQGNLLHKIPLPLAADGTSWNGALASPTLANIDADPDLEVVLNTVSSGIVAYDLPGTANARVLWSTGRGNGQRAASCIAPAPAAVDASVRANPSGVSDVVLSWQPQPGTAEYAIWRSSSRDMAGAVKIGRASATSHIDFGARAAGTSNFYQIRAVNVCGVSGP